ncbi:MAG: flotillin family protein [Candidatus Eisenbacteria bacterium]|uniref:Flotillin family protein n=1 Tax=Eiseniibacteriota bacterium TaxID=2212470 RepID=A0A933SAQ5_UNCEI|nr:flotillin family protein [Candidatus Eisenbacteria bacterium]
MAALFLLTPVLGFLLLVLVLFLLSGIRYIPNNKIGVIEKRMSGRGSIKSGIIALNGEAGFQPNMLRGGLHYLMPIQYAVHVLPIVTIPQGKIGYVFARDGKPLPPSQTLAANDKADDFQDAAVFLKAGGSRGPQRKILREGSYAIHLAQFVVIAEERVYALALDKAEEELFRRMATLIKERDGFNPVVIKGHDDMLGIVTVHDGPSLAQGQIIAPTVGEDPANLATYHNSFQDPERFLAGGGNRGRQYQVLVEGTYYINRLFATVELVPKTIVDVGNVGVVVSYTGAVGTDLSGEQYKHGELVQKGLRGVWSEGLMPGKYAFNTYAGKVNMVPTTNFILKWNKSESGEHKYDENLAEVSLITKDAFEPSLPLSVVVHIDYRKAPLVIQRFGDIKRLVEQTLDPMVSAYFKNIGQTRTLIQLIQDRSAIQQIAGDQMKEKFAQYNLELQEVLIGTPTSGVAGGQIEQILTQLRSRQIATEQVETYNRQEVAAVKERELREAEQRARQQAAMTESELSIVVQSNQGKADLARAQQEATKIQTLAQAEAEKVRIMGEGEAAKVKAIAGADAERAARVGVAQAMAIEEQVRAYGGPRFQLTQQVMNRFAEAIQVSKVDVVPRVVVGGGGAEGGGASGNVMEALLTMLLSEKMGNDLVGAAAGARSAEAAELRDNIRRGMSEGDKPKS